MLSVVILTLNSEKYLAEVLRSCEFADEVVVVDSGSQDATEQICSEFKNVKFHKQKWLGFSAQKQLGVDLARNHWVFVLDSDEVILEPLREEILQVLQRPGFCAYEVARANIFFGKEVRTMGLYPDYTVRLFDKTRAEFDGREIHEKVVLKSVAKTDEQTSADAANLTTAKNQIGRLKNHFKHYAYGSIEQFIAKQNRYSSLGAKGAKSSKFKAVLNPAWTFFKLFFLKGGWREGWRGYVIARLYSQYTFWKYVK
ncbi:glycosyltransferase, group 2 family protein [Campylobacter rectus RM3267]|uniref:Glycosyltransferase, family 2 n=2 Tax=Campylobacter rectus TaxID=203 RepID=A0A6G5QNZ9_CAMRE|nr:glycosyltransferase family 2 protein [Campylobacter rectus]EEF13554.1 glycosyltransferase, group 2 family protein [Campylobacter rectus RM3267]QCD47327.1 glycosyltransferase, family 2 [Campylobacter rectus]UEB48017.1 glycosyltransferase family 2 protein [Campylobacter rectus]